ncbi:DUF6266 family protein [Carboxylicivirga sp. M1479]|uniref:DUF6266 family protein n=1 Tax=Carboxylicivirga sp. M1479 TaxID=2594476 RepID=UPI00117743AD|nr:DUF6266 family protein [Carboxylicivirga sp. M1479]TRX70564.1 hypothetical protein FNN09_11340 [Carboxylicivirga sp. M1479]
MGQFKKGILGGFSGKVGNIIGSTWKGITYMRSLSEASNKTPSEKQMIVRARFAYASQFLQPLGPVLKVGYRTQTKKQSPQNAAMSIFMADALSGEYPAYRTDYEKLRIAKGTLQVANSPQVQLVGDEIEFTWDDSALNLKEHGDNYAVLLATGEELYPSYSLTEFRRDNKGGVLALPHGPSGSTAHCYLAFAQAEGSEVSNDVYVGSIVLP